MPTAPPAHLPAAAQQILIGIDIMKPEGISIDLETDLMKIGACKGIEVPVTVTTRGTPVNSAIYSRKQMSIPPRSNVAVPITGTKRRDLNLLTDRDFIFESQTATTLSVYAHIVDHNMSNVFVRNDTDYLVTLAKHVKLGNVMEYDAAGCYAINLDQHDLAIKAPKRRSNWIKTNVRRALATAAAFAAALASTPANIVTEVTHGTGVTIHGAPVARSAIAVTVNSFPNLWKDIGNVVNISESEHMDIPLIDDWREQYKPG